jgi:hypothetical protein
VAGRIPQAVGANGVLVQRASPGLGDGVLAGEEPRVGAEAAQVGADEAHEPKRLGDIDEAQLACPIVTNGTSSGSANVSMKAHASLSPA